MGAHLPHRLLRVSGGTFPFSMDEETETQQDDRTSPGLLGLRQEKQESQASVPSDSSMMKDSGETTRKAGRQHLNRAYSNPSPPGLLLKTSMGE